MNAKNLALVLIGGCCICALVSLDGLKDPSGTATALGLGAIAAALLGRRNAT